MSGEILESAPHRPNFEHYLSRTIGGRGPFAFVCDARPAVIGAMLFSIWSTMLTACLRLTGP